MTTITYRDILVAAYGEEAVDKALSVGYGIEKTYGQVRVYACDDRRCIIGNIARFRRFPTPDSAASTLAAILVVASSKDPTDHGIPDSDIREFRNTILSIVGQIMRLNDTGQFATVEQVHSFFAMDALVPDHTRRIVERALTLRSARARAQARDGGDLRNPVS